MSPIFTWIVCLIGSLSIQTAAPFCDKDSTEAMDVLVGKFRTLGERVDAAVQTRKGAIKDEIDEVKD